MKKAIFYIVTLSLFVAQTVSAAPTLTFTEIMYDLPGSDDNREWVEVYNNGPEPVEVKTGTVSSSWRFFDGSMHTLKLVQGQSILAPQSFAIFADNADIWKSEHPDFAGTIFDTVLSLRNSSSTIGVAEGSTQPLFTSVSYDSSWGGAGNGYSLEKKDTGVLSDDASNWIQSQTIGGTPGLWSPIQMITPTSTPPDQTPTSTPPFENATSTEPIAPTESGSVSSSSSSQIISWSRDIIINELLPNPIGSDTDGEWIELYNKSSVPVNLDGWKLQDTSSTVYTISEEDFALTDLDPGKYFIIPRSRSSIALNNTGGDAMKLYWPNGDLVDAVVYGGTAAENFSWARFDDAFQWATPTPNGLNQKKTVVIQTKKIDDDESPIVSALATVPNPTLAENDLYISEILPNPTGTDTDEWVEIKNNATTSIDLLGWRLDDIEGGSKPYRFASSTPIAPGQYFVIHKKESKLSLNNDIDSVRLLKPDDSLWQEVKYEKAPSGSSYSYDEKNDEWIWTSILTPSAPFVSEALDSAAVLGYERTVITNFQELNQDMQGQNVVIQGIVVVPPGVISVSKMFIEDSVQGVSNESLLEIYAYRKQLPKFVMGERIELEGVVSWTNDKPRIKVMEPEKIIVTGKGSKIVPGPIAIADMSDDSNGSFVSTQGTIDRINKISFSMSDEDSSMLVYPKGDAKISRLHLEKGAQVKIAGFLQYAADKPKLYVFQPSQVEILKATTTADVATSTRQLDSASQKPESPLQRWLYMGTVPVAIGIGLFFKKFFAAKLQ